jgi:hypothetical protein
VRKRAAQRRRDVRRSLRARSRSGLRHARPALPIIAEGHAEEICPECGELYGQVEVIATWEPASRRWEVHGLPQERPPHRCGESVAHLREGP